MGLTLNHIQGGEKAALRSSGPDRIYMSTTVRKQLKAGLSKTARDLGYTALAVLTQELAHAALKSTFYSCSALDRQRTRLLAKQAIKLIEGSSPFIERSITKLARAAVLRKGG